MSQRDGPVVKGTLTLRKSNISTIMTKIRHRVRSPRQQVAGLQWFIQAYPEVVDNVTYLACYLESENIPFKWSAWVHATFRIAKKNGGFGKDTNFPKRMPYGKEPLSVTWGFNDFITSEELLSADNGFVIDDSIKVRVDFCLTDVCGAAFNVFENVGVLAADIQLKVVDSVFYANKGYLSVVSSVFRDMFALTVAAEDNKEMDEIELKDLEASAFMEFLGVVYPTRYSVTDTNAISLFRIADRYDVKRVIADCESHLMSDNTVPWFDKLKLAVDLDRDNLMDVIISQMTCDDIMTINLNNNKKQLGMDVLQALHDKHIRIHRP